MEYKRLTEKSECGYNTLNGCFNCDLEMDCGLCPYWTKALDSLAELEDKIEQGTLIELPCKVGDTVYCVDRNRSACYDCEHYSSFYGMDEICEKGCTIYPDIEKLKPICDKHFLEIDEIPFTLKWYGNYKDGFNKDWFTTREEAEKRLKELQE